MNHLVYVAHGADCFVLEAVYSILSFKRRQASDGRGTMVRVVTDRPEVFRRYLGDDPQLQLLAVDAAQLQAWRGGPDGYVHRIKPNAILHAARIAGIAPDDNLLFLDSDTCLQVDAAVLFARIAAGEVLLNECEGRLSDLRGNTRSHTRLHDAVRDGRVGAAAAGIAPVPLDLPLWNSGVIGLRGMHLPAFEATIRLTDRLWPALQLPATEQVALSAVLHAMGVRPAEVLAEVLHYHVFKDFRADLEAFFAHYRGASPDQWVKLSAQVDPAERIQPKLAFNRLPKWWRQLRKAFGHGWKPLPYPWAKENG